MDPVNPQEYSETAQDLIKKVLPPFTIDEVKKALAAANDRLLQEGITSVQDAWAGWIAPREFKGYQDAVKEGLLQVRVILMPDVESIKVKDRHFDFGFGIHSLENYYQCGFGGMQDKYLIFATRDIDLIAVCGEAALFFCSQMIENVE
jgi:predicted amidohydrolase YtcJ